VNQLAEEEDAAKREFCLANAAWSRLSLYHQGAGPFLFRTQLNVSRLE
jgi:hypothetical protein